MPFFFMFPVVAVVLAVILGIVVVRVVGVIVRVVFRLLSLPFRLARRADEAVYNRLHRSLPVRLRREDDIQCSNRTCLARLPAEAKFCGRCGGALPARRVGMPSVFVDVRRHGYSQVA